MQAIYNVTQFGNIIGVKVKTLQKWDREGILKAYRTPTNRRYYTHQQVLDYLGEGDPNPAIDVIYGRVSSHGQKEDLKNQLDFVAEWCHREGISIGNVFSDIGSGLNFNRKDWNRLIDECFEGHIRNIYVSHKDRFIRFGFDWLQDMLKTKLNVNLIAINDVVSSPEDELVQDLITIIHVFSCRIYGLRKYKKAIAKEFGVKDDE